MSYKYSRQSFERTTAQTTAQWNVIQTAFLNDIARRGLSCRIDSVGPDNIQSMITVAADPIPPSRPRQGPYSINWRVRQTIGNNPALGAIVAKAINLEGTPTASTPKYGDTSQGLPIRPYRDTLFKDGSLEVTLPATETNTAAPQIFDFGKVVGLVILVNPRESHEVWTPLVPG